MYSTQVAGASTPQPVAIPASRSGGARQHCRDAALHCVRANPAQCMSKSIGERLHTNFGHRLEPDDGARPVGLRMTGDYAAADGFRLIFEPDQVTMVCRGVPAARPYSVKMTDTQVTITIQNDKPSRSLCVWMASSPAPAPSA